MRVYKSVLLQFTAGNHERGSSQPPGTRAGLGQFTPSCTMAAESSDPQNKRSLQVPSGNQYGAHRSAVAMLLDTVKSRVAHTCLSS